MQIVHPQHTHTLWSLQRAEEQQTAVCLPVSPVSVLDGLYHPGPCLSLLTKEELKLLP